jgi:hypothetical protein
VVYIVIALSFAFAGGLVGKIKGGSFFLWFLISGIVPFIGLVAAVLYRFDSEEPRRLCPECGKTCMLHDALCTRCGCELDFPDDSELVPPTARA